MKSKVFNTVKCNMIIRSGWTKRGMGIEVLDNGEQGQAPSFKDEEITFIHKFLRAPEKDGRNCEESEKV
uniref:Uncharacterized protein n=1 Tax=Candidatus Methanophaga sp. ANME-1 ERB7 TaxID=2759913 RepID=A0A7G9Z3F0_9EURY|nr:hypothetical protein PNEAJHEF_00008 [Methanosarcinales archaeon ANME-1 ERB7]